MTAQLRLLSDVAANGGVVLSEVPDYIGGLLSLSDDGEGDLQVLDRPDADWLESVAPRRVLHVTLGDGSVHEFRLGRDQKRMPGEDVVIVADPLDVDLTDCGLIHERITGGGVITTFGFIDESISDLIQSYVIERGLEANGVTTYLLGTVDVPGTLTGQFRDMTPRAFLGWLEANTSGRYSLVRDGDSGYLIDFRLPPSAGPEARLAEGVHLVEAERTRDRVDMVTAVVAGGAQGMGFAPWPIIDITWPDISFVGIAGDLDAAGFSIDLTGIPFQAGDVAVLFVTVGADTAPAVPTGWEPIDSQASAVGPFASRACYRVLLAGDTAVASGTPIGTRADVVVLRGVDPTNPIGATAKLGEGVASQTDVPIPALTCDETDGRSWVVGFAGQRDSDSNIKGLSHTGFTNRSSGLAEPNQIVAEDQQTVTSVASSNVTGSNSQHNSYSIELRAAQRFFVTVEAPNGGDGPIAMDGQHAPHPALGIAGNYLFLPDGTSARILDSWAEASTPTLWGAFTFAVAAQTFEVDDPTGFTVGSEPEIAADADGSVLNELVSPVGYAAGGRMARPFTVEVEGTSADREFAPNAHLESWSELPTSTFGYVQGTQAPGTTVDLDGFGASHFFPAAGTLISNGTRWWTVRTNATANGSGEVTLNIGAHNGFADGFRIFVLHTEDPPDGWADPNAAADISAGGQPAPISYEPDDEADLSCQLSGAHSSATVASLKSLTPGDVIRAGNFLRIGGQPVMAAAEITADGSGLAAVPLVGGGISGSDDDAVTIERVDLSTQDETDEAVDTFGNLLTIWPSLFSGFGTGWKGRVRLPAATIRFREGYDSVSATVCLLLRSPAAYSLASADTPEIRLHDGSSYVAAAGYKTVALAGGDQVAIILQCTAPITETTTYQVEIRGCARIMIATVLWASLALTFEPSLDPLEGSANADTRVFQALNRTLANSDEWPAQYRVLAREIVDEEGLEVPLTAPRQVVRLTAPGLGEDQKLRVRRIVHDLTDPRKKEVVLATAFPSAAQRIVAVAAGASSATVSGAGVSVGDVYSTDEADALHEALEDLIDEKPSIALVATRVLLGV